MDQLVMTRVEEEERRNPKKPKLDHDDKPPVASGSGGIPIAVPIAVAPRPPKKPASLFVPKKVRWGSILLRLVDIS